MFRVHTPIIRRIRCWVAAYGFQHRTFGFLVVLRAAGAKNSFISIPPWKPGLAGTRAQSCHRYDCILGKFLGVVCYCFPPPLDVPTLAARSVRNDASGGERCPVVILPKFRLPRKFRDMGPTALLPLRRKACWEFFRPKNPTASAGFEPANLGTKGQHATPRPPKPWS